MRRRPLIVCFLAVVTFLPGILWGQNNQPMRQTYQQPNQQATNQQNPQPNQIQRRPATPEELKAMQDAITQQQQSRNNPLAAQPQLPEGFPLPANQNQFIDELLVLWQKSSNQVKRSSCDFIRRSYNPENCQVRDSRNNHLFPYNMALGKVYFAAPDKGRFENRTKLGLCKTTGSARRGTRIHAVGYQQAS